MMMMMMMIQITLSSARRPRITTSDLCLHVFLSSADSCSLVVLGLSGPTDWRRVFIDCIHVAFCRPLGLVAGFNVILNPQFFAYFRSL